MWSLVAEAPDKPVYLITGSDRPKVDTALARLRGHFEAESIEVVSAVETTGDEAVVLCNAGSLFGDGRLVVVSDVDGVKADRGRRGGWKAADVEAVSAYLSSPAPETVLALVAEELKPTSALWKACAKAGTVLGFDVDKKLGEWVAKQAAARGLRAEPDAVAALVELIGEDLRALATEIDKLATWADSEPIGGREVHELVAPVKDLPPWELTDAWSEHDPVVALSASERMFEREPRQRRDTASRLAALLGGHLNRIRSLKRLAADGVTSKDAAEHLKMHPFRARKLYGQAEGFSEEELDEAVLRLAELDGALKGQSRLAPDLVLQRTLVDLTRRAASA